jgi:aminopeptidase N
VNPGVRGFLIVVLCAGALALAAGTGQAGHEGFTPGAPGLGDDYFPLYGNGGYDVKRYELDIRYDPATDRLSGRALIVARATKDLSRFNLDFVGLELRQLKVNGRAAQWRRPDGHELVVTPRRDIRKGRLFRVLARYTGVPSTFTVPGEAIQTGVAPTDDGALIWGEPEVAAAWFPVNDHPRDKATYRINLTVPAGLEAIANGRFLGRRSSSRDWTTWRWREDDPMASYLAMAAIGEFDVRRARTEDGPLLDAVDPRVGTAADWALGMQDEIVDFLERRFGRYPFDDLGAVVEFHDLFGALETQTRAIYLSPLFINEPGDEIVIVHEYAHMWYGDSVSVDEWKHIWLNEGPATYAEWLWIEDAYGETAQEAYDFFCSLPADHPLWEIAPGDPGADRLFDGAVFIRSAMTLHALRREVGDSDFFRILRAWAASRQDGTGSTTQFVRLAERISREQLDELFEVWLFVPGKPEPCGDSAGAREPWAARPAIIRMAPRGLHQ